MICPFAGLASLGAVVTAGDRLLVRDVRGRTLSASLLVVLAAAWALYFVAARQPAFRIGLEVASVAALLAAALRVRELVRTGAVAPLLDDVTRRRLAPFVRAIASPWVAATKGALALMLVLAATGRASFAWWEFAAVAAVLLGLLGWRLTRPAPARPWASLDRYATTGAPAAECPFGFGDVAPEETTGGREATR